MITARINFLQNNITVNLSQTPIRLRDDLQNIGVLTSQNLILLDNSRTLKIELYPKDSCGKYIWCSQQIMLLYPLYGRTRQDAFFL